MDEDSPDGCYGLYCEDCEYENAEPGSDKWIRCQVLRMRAINKEINEDE